LELGGNKMLNEMIGILIFKQEYRNQGTVAGKG
jgi:hypothetical protein